MTQSALMKKYLVLFWILCFGSSTLILGQSCCPEIIKSSINTGKCKVTNGGSCGVCKDTEVTLSIEDAKNLPENGVVSWYYSSLPNFNPAIGQGTLIGTNQLPGSDCDNAPTVKFNEVMVRPASNDDNNTGPTTGEWIELIGPPGTDISCYIITDGDWAITIPPGYSIPSDGLFVVGFASVTGADVDLDLSGCGCYTFANINTVLVLDNGGEYLLLWDGNSIADAFRWGNPTFFNNFPFGDLASGMVIPTVDFIGCVKTLPLALPTFQNQTALTPAGESYSRKPDHSGSWVVSCATLGKCNIPAPPSYPVEQVVSFSTGQCNQKIYLRGLITPKPSSCPNAVLTPVYTLFVSCPESDLKETLCNNATKDVNGTTYDKDNPSGTEVFAGQSYLGCDSIVNVDLKFFPEVTAILSGGGDICLGQSIELLVNFTGQGPWTFEYEQNGFLVSIITTSSNPYKLIVSPQSSSTYSLGELFDVNNCEGTVSGEAEVNVGAPKAFLEGIDSSLCAGDTIRLAINLSGTPDFVFTYLINGKEQPAITTDKLIYYINIVPTDTTIIKLKEMVDDQGCKAQLDGIDSLFVRPALQAINIIENCLPGNIYVVTFEATGGDPNSWVVNGGGTLTDSLFTSINFGGGSTYTLILDDGTNCPADTLSNTVKCNCQNSTGSMNTSIIHACIGETVTANYLKAGEILESGDTILFVLHDNSGNSLGNIVATNTIPVFQYTAGIVPEQTYYISAVVGNQIGVSQIDFADDCLDVALGTPVIFHDLPTADLILSNSVCAGFCIPIGVNLLGNGLIDLSYEVTSSTGTVTTIIPNLGNAFSGQICSILGDAGTQIEIKITNVSDDYCGNPTSEKQLITVYGASVTDFTKSLCFGQTIQIGNTTYDETKTTGQEFLPNAAWTGCDSIINVNLSFVSTVIENQTPKICGGSTKIINGTVFSELNPTGSFSFPGGSVAGCDSILNVNALIVQASNAIFNPTLCFGESVSINGKTYNASNPVGFENLNGQSWTGCDSIVQINLNVLPAIFFLYKDTLCANESVKVNGTTYTAANPAGLEKFLTGSFQGCDSTVQVSILFIPDINAKLTGPSSVCPSADVKLIFETDGLGLFDVTISSNPGGNGTFNGLKNGDEINIGPLASATSFVIVAVSSTGLECTVILGPALTVSPSGLQADIAITSDFNGYDVSCINATDGSISVNVLNGTAPFTYLWSNSANTANITNLGLGSYQVSITDSEGCGTIKSIDLIGPPVVVANWLAEDAGCGSAASGSITLSQINGGVPPFTVAVNGGAAQAISSGFVLANLSSGSFSLLVTDGNGCLTNETVEVNQKSDSNIFLDAGPDVTIEAGKQKGLNATTNAIVVNTLWSPAAGLDCSTCLDPVARPDTTTTYNVTITDLDGCTSSDQITVFVLSNDLLFVPNVFSPNLDGRNDLLNIFSGDRVKNINTFAIYDRWGEAVFISTNHPLNDPQSGWNGKLNGQLVNPGVFVYYIEIELTDGSKRLLKGDVTVLK